VEIDSQLLQHLSKTNMRDVTVAKKKKLKTNASQKVKLLVS
jgi:hypothetical protein